MVPESGPRMFRTMRSVVVLPAPFGPEETEDAAPGNGEGEVLDRDVAGERLGHAGDADGGFAQEAPFSW